MFQNPVHRNKPNDLVDLEIAIENKKREEIHRRDFEDASKRVDHRFVPPPPVKPDETSDDESS